MIDPRHMACKFVFGSRQKETWMSTWLRIAAPLAASTIMLVCPAFAFAEPARFDLVCSGDLQTSSLWTKKEGVSELSTIRLRIDLQHSAFCVDNYCDALTQVDAATIKYHCVAHNGEQFCGWGTETSTAGPFISQQDFEFDRSSRALRRSKFGSAGDIASGPYAEKFTGTCAVEPFRGLDEPGTSWRRRASAPSP